MIPEAWIEVCKIAGQWFPGIFIPYTGCGECITGDSWGFCGHGIPLRETTRSRIIEMHMNGNYTVNPLDTLLIVPNLEPVDNTAHHPTLDIACSQPESEAQDMEVAFSTMGSQLETTNVVSDEQQDENAILSDDDNARTSCASRFVSPHASECTIPRTNRSSSPKSSNITNASKDSRQRLTLEKHVTPGEGADQQTNDPTDQEGSDIASNAGSDESNATTRPTFWKRPERKRAGFRTTKKVTPPSIEGLSHPIEVLTGLSRQRHMPTKSLEEKFLPECYRAEDVNGKMVCKLPVSIDYDGELRWIKTMCNSNSLPSQYRRHLIGDHLVMGRPDHKSHETMGMKIDEAYQAGLRLMGDLPSGGKKRGREQDEEQGPVTSKRRIETDSIESL